MAQREWQPTNMRQIGYICLFSSYTFHTLQPIVFETFGAINASSAEFLSILTAKSNEHGTDPLSISLQRFRNSLFLNDNFLIVLFA